MTQHYLNAADTRLEPCKRAFAAPADVAPNFGCYLPVLPLDYGHRRPGLSPREREIAAIAALTATGNTAQELKIHVWAGLNAGLSRDEIIEIIMQMVGHAGFPAAINGLFAAKEVFNRFSGGNEQAA